MRELAKKVEFVFSNWSGELLSILRIITAFMFMQHGGQKLFDFPVLGNDPEWFSRIWWAGVLEVYGGALILLGLFTRPVSFLMAGLMAFAYFLAHAPRDFWTRANEGDAAVLYCFVFLYMMAAGGGPWSLDRLWRKTD